MQLPLKASPAVKAKGAALLGALAAGSAGATGGMIAAGSLPSDAPWQAHLAWMVLSPIVGAVAGAAGGAIGAWFAPKNTD